MGASQTAAELGLMEGYPAPPERRVTVENLLLPPFNRWAFQHMRELLPTAEVARGSGPVAELEYAPLDLGAVTFSAADGTRHSIAQFLNASDVDAFVVLREGRLVFERYFNGMNAASPHQMMSVTKSLVGTMAAQLAHEGLIDLSAPASYYVPELIGSAWEDAGVRHVLDMTTGIRFEEIYDDPTSDVGRYAIATGLIPTPQSYDGARDLAAYLPSLRKEGEHGAVFHYVTPNTDIAGWIIARVTGQPFSRLFSERIWSQIGAERDAYIIKDRSGMLMTGGGFNATARDLARFGQLILQDGSANGRQLIDLAVIADIRAGGDKAAFARGMDPSWGAAYEGWSYRSYWWVTHNAHGSFTGIGINGQWLYIDPTARMVAVVQSSQPHADEPETDDKILRGLHAIARALREG
jgi:CubicO group peptidase (beta-lactamase class C family)